MSSFQSFRSTVHFLFPTVILLIASLNAAGQSSALTGSSLPTGPDPVQQRIERARALAAAHQLQLAANELENVRASVKDVTLRNVTTLMLMGIYLEEGNYIRAQALLEESFQVRATQKDESLRTYFAMAGQTLNGLRSHLDRYRTWAINTSDSSLPAEVNSDLDRVRVLLERIVAQSKEIAKEDGRAYDALALQEDVLSIRLSVAKNSDDHDKWQTEYVAVREKLASIQGPVSSITRTPALGSVTAKIPNPFTAKTPAGDDEGDNSSATSSARDGSAKSTVSQASSSPSPEPNRVSGPAQPAAAEPQLVSTGSLSGRETQRVTPTYPQIAKNSGVTGTVRVFAIIDEKGKLWVTNSEGPTLLRRAAEDAARRWTFPPIVMSGKVVRLAGFLDFDFKP